MTTDSGSFSNLVVSGDNAFTVDFTSAGATATVTDTSTGASDTIGVAAATAFYATPSPTAHAAINIAKTFHVRANGLSTATITGHVNADGSFAGTVALNNTTPVAMSLTMTGFASSPYSVTFTDSTSLTDPSAISLITTELPASQNNGGLSLRLQSLGL